MFRCFVAVALLCVAVPSLVQCYIYRLPENVKPVRYFLTMEPNLTLPLQEPAPYIGSVVIELKAVENTKNVTLHSSEIDIDVTSIKVVSYGAEVKVARTSSDKNQETYTLHLEEELVQNEFYNLTIGSFGRNLSGDGEGFFLARYLVNHTGDTRGIAITSFEPTGARIAFPCFDEPALKARFTVSLIRRNGQVALSNGELEMTENLHNGRFKDTFRETPEMSTFLVAFSVSDLKSTKKWERNRIFARREAVDAGELDYALEVSAKTLRVLEEFIGFNYTLSKMDVFAVPMGYFHQNAMENWGLVVFSEEHIRYSNESSQPAVDLKSITIAIAHEFAHQWFGNLVTPKWWDYLWLSESFATYFQYYVASLVQPTWRLMDQFVIDNMYKAFRYDDFPFEETQSLTAHIARSGELPFFHIMYQKGSSIVRMMSHFLSQDVFQKGLRLYLQRRQFKTAVPSDLYDAFQDVVDEENANHLLENQSVADIMGTWENLAGFPIVTVTRNYTTGSITFKQSTIFSDGNAKKNWKIPINYVFSHDGNLDFTKTTADFWLTEESKTIDTNVSADGLLLVNIQQTGYYRVNYDTENWERITDFLKSDKFKSIHVLNRAQLIFDAFYLAHHKEINVDVPFQLCEYLAREIDYIPLAAFYNGLSAYVSLYSGRGADTAEERNYFKRHPLSNSISPYEPGRSSQEYKIFQQYVRTVTKSVRDYLGNKDKPGESFLDQINRYEIHIYFPGYFREQ